MGFARPFLRPMLLNKCIHTPRFSRCDVTWFHRSKARFHLCVVGTEGTLDIKRLSPAGYVLTVTQSDSVVKTIKQTQYTGVKAEIEQFISSVKLAKKVEQISSLNDEDNLCDQGEEDVSDGAKRLQPEEGFRDLVVFLIICTVLCFLGFNRVGCRRSNAEIR